MFQLPAHLDIWRRCFFTKETEVAKEDLGSWLQMHIQIYSLSGGRVCFFGDQSLDSVSRETKHLDLLFFLSPTLLVSLYLRRVLSKDEDGKEARSKSSSLIFRLADALK